jgi:hypothetical protein
VDAVGQVLSVVPDCCGHPGRIREAARSRSSAATPALARAGSRIRAAIPGREISNVTGGLRATSPNVIAVRQPLAPAVPVLDPHRADRDQLAHRPVNRVRGFLSQSTRQRGPPGHPGARGVSVTQQHRVQAHCAVTDVSIQKPLRNNCESLLNYQLGLVIRLLRHGAPPLRRVPSSLDTDMDRDGPTPTFPDEGNEETAGQRHNLVLASTQRTGGTWACNRAVPGSNPGVGSDPAGHPPGARGPPGQPRGVAGRGPSQRWVRRCSCSAPRFA